MPKNYRTFRRNSGRNFRPPYKKREEPRKPSTGMSFKQLPENEVGITEYLSQLKGIHGIIKSRYSDFHVNEISLDEQEAILTDLSVPEPERMEAPPAEELDLIKNGLITAEQYMNIKEIADGNATVDAVDIDVTNLEKISRTEIHQTLKKIFGTVIVATTLDEEKKKLIRVKKFVKYAGFQRMDWNFPGDYVHFILHKENIDTVQAIMLLAEKIGAKPAAFTYAGTKDKRAKTSQWVSVKRINPSRICGAAKRLQQIKVGNFQFKKEPLKLGDLKGNRFQIVLRNVTAEKDEVQQAMDQFQTKGFINYFGLQRFGNASAVPTFEVGKALLKGQWKEAVELILKPRDGENESIKEMRDYWWETRDSVGARGKLPTHCTFVEAKILDGLIAHGENDYTGALNNVARNMRLLYVHSYQSLIWNRITSKRIQSLGMDLKEGDLVYVDGSEVKEVLIEDELDGEQEDKEEQEEKSVFKAMVKALTKEEAESGKYSIYDCVLPLPGHDITYPGNEVAQWYEEMLEADELSSEKLKQKNKLYSLGGAYRKILVKPENLDWRLVEYNKPEDPIILSDVEKLNGKTIPEEPDFSSNTALVLDFRLPSSTYATMALREILKSDTSPANQSRLGEAAKRSAGESFVFEVDVESDEDSMEVTEKKIKLDVDGVAESNDSSVEIIKEKDEVDE